MPTPRTSRPPARPPARSPTRPPTLLTLPLAVSWYAYNLPGWLLHLAAAFVLLLELPGSFLTLVPFRIVRLTVAALQMTLHACAGLAGNHGITPLACMVLTLSLIDDEAWAAITPENVRKWLQNQRDRPAAHEDEDEESHPLVAASRVGPEDAEATARPAATPEDEDRVRIGKQADLVGMADKDPTWRKIIGISTALYVFLTAVMLFTVDVRAVEAQPATAAPGSPPRMSHLRARTLACH